MISHFFLDVSTTPAPSRLSARDPPPFYKILPFNCYGSIEEQVKSVAQNSPIEQQYPPLKGLVTSCKNILEIGMFTGFSALKMAEVLEGIEMIVLPSDGKSGVNPFDLNKMLELMN